MLEKMKVLSFVPESKAIKIERGTERVWGSRYDKVTYLREILPINFEAEQPVYVVAEEFLPLVPFIQSARATESYLLVTLRNGAEYKLAYLDVQFETPELEDSCTTIITNTEKLDILKKTTLQNLIRPDMRCIYVDERGAVSCNFQQGTVCKSITSIRPVLLPPDLIDYIEGKMDIAISGDTLLAMAADKVIFSPVADIVEEEEPWFNSIYGLADAAENNNSTSQFIEIDNSLADSLKRLSNFGNKVVFNSNKITAGESFEPVNIPTAVGDTYDIENVNSVISFGKEILFAAGAMFLRNDDTIVLVSAEEEI